MIQDSLDGYYQRPVAFTAESTYLDWQTEFPSLSICVRPHPTALSEAANLYAVVFLLLFNQTPLVDVIALSGSKKNLAPL